MDKRRIILCIAIISIAANTFLLAMFKNDIKKMIVPKNHSKATQVNSHIHKKYSSYQYCDTIYDITLLHQGVHEVELLSPQLIVKPGVYKIGDDVVDMRKEGLYRIIVLNNDNYQVIAYEKDLKALLSALAWIHTHGDVDNKLVAQQLSNKAIHDKIYLTCSKIAGFASDILNANGYKTRIVGGIASDSRNGFDDEHTLLELFEPKTNKWVVADIDNNSVFKRKGAGELLSFIEFRDALYANELEQVLLSRDVIFDISGFKSKDDYTLGFIMERRNNPVELLNWYKRIFKSMIIDHEFYSKLDTERIRKEHPYYTYLDSTSLIEKYYGEPLLGNASEHRIAQDHL
jgi:hypothetical protein